MTVARPPIVSQAEWGSSLAALLEREETVAGRDASSSPRHASACRWCGSSTTTFRGPRRVAVAARAVRGSEPAHPLPVLLRGGRRRLARRRLPRLLVLRRRHSPARASPLARHHLRDGVAVRRSRISAATPSAWAGPTCPGTRSAPRASRRTSGSTSGSGSTYSCATATTSTAPTSSSTGRWCSSSAASGAFGRSLPTAGRARRGRARGLAAGPGRFWFRRHDEFDEPPPSAGGGAGVS